MQYFRITKGIKEKHGHKRKERKRLDVDKPQVGVGNGSLRVSEGWERRKGKRRVRGLCGFSRIY